MYKLFKRFLRTLVQIINWIWRLLQKIMTLQLNPIDEALSKLKDIAVIPGSDEYKSLTKIYNPAFDSLKPAFIAVPNNLDDLKRCLEVADTSKVRVTIKSGGHSFAGYSTTDREGFVITLKNLTKVTVEGESVIVQAGARWADVYQAVEGAGYIAVGGCCVTVGVGGYILGGGYGLLSRGHGGMACDMVLSFTMITADGKKVVTASANENTDLFWALRGGGGGNYGVVYEIELKLALSPKTFYWDNVTIQSQDIKSTLEYISTNLKVISRKMNVDMMFDTHALSIDIVYSDDSYDAATSFIKKLTGKKSSYSSTSYVEFVTKYSNAHGYVEYEAKPVYMKGTILNALSPALIDYLVNLKIPSQPYCNVTLVQMGGDIGDVASNATAFPYRDGQYSIYTYSQYKNDEEKKVIMLFANSVYESLKQFPESNGSYINYMDRELENWQEEYYSENYDRLVEIKQRWNPIGTGSLHFQQEIGAQ